MQTPHHATIQLSGIRLKIRNDLSVAVREFGGEPLYVIEDEYNSRFFRLGMSEYTFLSFLDGRTTFADALGHTASVMKEDALTESDAASLCRWLVESGLASTDESRSSGRLFEAAERVRDKTVRSRLNPMFIKVPLFNPDQPIKFAAGLIGWLFSWPVFAVWLLVFGTGCACVSQRWSEVTSMTSSVISDNNWIWLTATWLLLKLVHESAHGIACRRFGGTVREAGVMSILFVPLPFVDVTSAWRLNSRWQRLVVSAAGMYAELFLAAVAAIVWFQSEPGLLHQHAFNLMFTASAVTLIFNANPLMRFDGYYMLTDILEMPNLATHGQACALQLGRRWFCGLPTAVQRWPEGRTGFVVGYGVAALIWRVLICIGLVAAADAMFYGAGVLIAALAISFWVIVPLCKLARFIAVGTKTERPSRRRFLCATGGIALAVFILSQLPWYQRTTAPVVVEFDTLLEIRSPLGGFVEDVLVECGDQIGEGTDLVRLSNPEVESERRQIYNQLLQARQRARLYHQQTKLAAWQVEVQAAQSLSERLDQLDEQLDALQIVAPRDGIVLNSDLRSRIGSWVAAGENVVSLGSGNKKSLLALISEDNLDAFLARQQQPVDIHIAGNGFRLHRGILQPVDPQATTRIIHPAFASSTGGPLEVRIVNSTRDSPTSSQTSSLELVRPHFIARVVMNAKALSDIHAGRTGRVGFRVARGTIGEVAGRGLRRWFQQHCRALQTIAGV